MREVEGERHIVFSLICGITKHHSLVASTLIHRVFTFHATIDVRTLFMNGTQHATRVTFKHILTLGIANTFNHLASHEWHVDISLGFHFASQHHLSCGHQRFAGHLGVRVISQQFVENGVRDLIRHFVWVSFRHRFRCK